MIHDRQALIRVDSVHSEQMRYATEGDWRTGNGVIQVEVVSNMPRREQILIAIHELVEAFLCTERGITQEAVDTFDMQFTGEGEPGDSPDAPYRREHRFAALVDHLIAHELGMQDYGRVDWEPRE
jgi:hypothetical protein